MPTHAILGATGSTGSALLRIILSQPLNDLSVHILVRSKHKLLRAFPELKKSIKPSIFIFEGSSTDTSTLESCLINVDVVFMCVGQNESKPGSTICYDSAISALETLKSMRKLQGTTYSLPTIVQLRSASLNPVFARQVPRMVHKAVSFCLHYNYVDMESACEVWQAAAEDELLHYVFVDPPTLHNSSGRERTGHKIIFAEAQKTSLSYADLGAALWEIGTRTLDFRNMAVGVTATGKVQETWGVLVGYLASGAKHRVVDLVSKPRSQEGRRSALTGYTYGMYEQADLSRSEGSQWTGFLLYSLPFFPGIPQI